MIRTTAVPRPVRAGGALVGVLGMVALAGCAGTTTPAADAEETTPATTAPSSSAATGTDTGSIVGSAYTDGTYTAEGSYSTPESVETVEVTITLESDVVTAVEVTGDPQAAESKRYQSEFIGGISDEVVGKLVDDVSVSRVAGSSLTSGGFTKALQTIKSEAAA
ncbi:hypothetical protein DEA06_01140 [Microbacterium sp. Gd 4-13]|uniref:hypothetical protein n=1 Tax=Microbacterium sp. Gd 4-13 TaxID=2173179 RepID=UPI000D576244|nr:hypothetical protein [Microbacterium sp. Gd 4-13]PVW06187.1 hypothetical protein DEA06_01140 [Microbacterium sp. Gd 4-13]